MGKHVEDRKHDVDDNSVLEVVGKPLRRACRREDQDMKCRRREQGEAIFVAGPASATQTCRVADCEGRGSSQAPAWRSRTEKRRVRQQQVAGHQRAEWVNMLSD